jgi:hypothetical protein
LRADLRSSIVNTAPGKRQYELLVTAYEHTMLNLVDDDNDLFCV